MALAATSRLALPLAQLRAKVLASATWSQWCGGPSGADANTFLCACDAKTPTPHCIIDYDTTAALDRDGVHDGTYLMSGTLLLYFCAQALTPATYADAMTDFLNRIGAVIQDIETQPSNGGQGLIVDSINFKVSPTRMRAELKDKNGDFIETLFAVQFRSYP